MSVASSSSSKPEKRGREEDIKSDDEEHDVNSEEPEDDVDLVHLSTVPQDFQFDAAAHKKIIGVYTEKGGVGKTNFILSCIRCGVFGNSKTLIIDTDPQNNVVNGFMTPTIIKKNAGLFMTWADFVQDSLRGTKNNSKTAFTLTRPSHITIVFGASLSTGAVAVFDSERNFSQLTTQAKMLISSIRSQLNHYDVVLIDFNPKMSLFNKILLMACDEVVQLVTGDIHSQSAISSLSDIREEECKIFNANANSESDKLGPRRFNITIAPSLIDRSRNSLRQGHRVFVEKIFDFVKEKFSAGCTDIFFRGYVGRSHSIYGERPIKLLLKEKEPGSRADVAVMVEDVKRILLHCLTGGKEDMIRHKYVFPWIAVKDESEEEKYLKETKKEHKNAAMLYIFQAVSDPSLYKIGHANKVANRRKSAKAEFKETWNFVIGFCSTKAIVLELENKLLDYFSTCAEVGETVRYRPGDGRSELFKLTITQLEERSFVESLLLES